MRSDEELRAFLRDELGPRLEHWRGQFARRRPLLRGPRDWALVAAALAAAVLLRSLWPLLLPALAIGGPALREATRLHGAWRRDVLERVVAFVAPGLHYQGSGGIDARLVRGSGLFPEGFDACACEDFVAGRVGGTQLRFGEVRLTRRKKKSTETTFRGIFLIADFPKSFRGRVLLLPDRAERALGAFGRAFQQLSPFADLALVELEDPDFERYFACYGSDPVETRYLLSPALMQRLVHFRENTGARLRLALAGDWLLLALPVDRDFFAVPFGAPAVDEATLRTWVGELLFVTGIVEDLDLDTRIWSKAPLPGAAPRAAAR